MKEDSRLWQQLEETDRKREKDYVVFHQCDN